MHRIQSSDYGLQNRTMDPGLSPTTTLSLRRKGAWGSALN